MSKCSASECRLHRVIVTHVSDKQKKAPHSKTSKHGGRNTIVSVSYGYCRHTSTNRVNSIPETQANIDNGAYIDICRSLKPEHEHKRGFYDRPITFNKDYTDADIISLIVAEYILIYGESTVNHGKNPLLCNWDIYAIEAIYSAGVVNEYDLVKVASMQQTLHTMQTRSCNSLLSLRECTQLLCLNTH